jgi:hypothetical protein
MKGKTRGLEWHVLFNPIGLGNYRILDPLPIDFV